MMMLDADPAFLERTRSAHHKVCSIMIIIIFTVIVIMIIFLSFIVKYKMLKIFIYNQGAIMMMDPVAMEASKATVREVNSAIRMVIAIQVLFVIFNDFLEVPLRI